MSRIYISTQSADDWRRFLAEPEIQWRRGYSARAAAHAWQQADGFPREVAELFASAEEESLRNAELILAIPEHKVPLPPTRGRPSQNDVFALAKAGDGELVSIAVEAKVSEPFADSVEQWFGTGTPGKVERLQFLVDKLGLHETEIGHIRYQLLHRLASALLEAERFNASYALFVVHSFSRTDKWFQDFQDFLALYERKIEVGQLIELGLPGGKRAFAGWARGNPKYLEA